MDILKYNILKSFICSHETFINVLYCQNTTNEIRSLCWASKSIFVDKIQKAKDEAIII